MMQPQCSHVKQFDICLIYIKIDSGHFGYLTLNVVSCGKLPDGMSRNPDCCNRQHWCCRRATQIHRTN